MIARHRSVADAGGGGPTTPAVDDQSPALLGDATADDAAVGQPGLAVRFVVRTNQRALFIKASEVDWIEAARNYVLLHVETKQYRLRATLHTLLERLDPRQFARIHKSIIVNLDRIREIQPWFGGDYVALLHDGRKLRVSRTYARALLRPIQ